MLGVELEEEFMLDFRCSTYKFTENGLYFYDKNGHWWQCSNVLLPKILKGEIAIKKLPWKPKGGDRYYYATWMVGADGALIGTNDSVYRAYFPPDCMNVDIGNCFKTREEAEAAKYEVYKRLTGKDWSEVHG